LPQLMLIYYSKIYFFYERSNKQLLTLFRTSLSTPFTPFPCPAYHLKLLCQSPFKGIFPYGSWRFQGVEPRGSLTKQRGCEIGRFGLFEGLRAWRSIIRRWMVEAGLRRTALAKILSCWIINFSCRGCVA